MPVQLLVLTTCGSRHEAQSIARELLRRRLVACANLGGRIESHYIWQGREEQAFEYPLMVKTTRRLYPRVEREILRLHSYDTPEVVALEIARGSTAYLRWISEVTRTASARPQGAARKAAQR